MESVLLHQVPYQFSSSVREDKLLRDSFNQLARLTYGFDFLAWRQCGLWTNGYQPHCLIADGQVVANISVIRMAFCWEGRPLSMIQLGTVMTRPDFRGRGLSRYLMERILQVYGGTVDLIYLFANHTVLEFYPKFGFSPVEETLFSREMPAPSGEVPRRLDADADFSLLLEMVQRGKPQGAPSFCGKFSLRRSCPSARCLPPSPSRVFPGPYWDFPQMGWGAMPSPPFRAAMICCLSRAPQRNSSENSLSGFPPFPTHDGKNTQKSPPF